MSAFVLSGCGTIRINDVEVCGDLGSEGATCAYMNSDVYRDITKAQWDDERMGQLCMKPEGYAEIKAALLKLCRTTKRCSWETKQAIEEAAAKIDILIQRGKSVN